jgi:hypothetical protein
MSRLTPLLIITAVILAAVLIFKGGEVLTALAIGATNSTFATVNLTNEQPVVYNVRCWDISDYANVLSFSTLNLSLLGGEQKTIYCNATVNNPEGLADLGTGSGTVRENTVNDNCAGDNRNCYVNETCANQTDLNTTAREIRCTYKLWFNTDNTTISGLWSPNITIRDSAGGFGFGTATTGNRTNFSVNSLLAIGVDTVIAFGSKTAGVNMTNVGSTSTSDSATVCIGASGGCNHTSYNYGNVRIDVRVNASTMSCTLAGSITAGYLHTNLTYNSIYSQSYAMTNALGGPFGDFDLVENNVASTAAPSATTKQTYWGIGVPPATSGSCQGIIFFAAISG